MPLPLNYAFFLLSAQQSVMTANSPERQGGMGINKESLEKHFVRTALHGQLST